MGEKKGNNASPADLVANKAGMDFWIDLMDSKAPTSMAFDICNYVTKQWDESLNPNIPDQTYEELKSAKVK